MFKVLKNILVSTLLLYSLSALPTENSSAPEWEWEELIPEDYEFPNPAADMSDEEFSNLMDDDTRVQALMDEIKALQDNAPIVEALNGKKGTISGYAMPLDFEDEQVREFLLVPYFGACIHVPPPPGNQTIYVIAKQPFTFESMWDPVTISGTLQTVHTDTELAVAGYQMEADEVRPFEPEPEPESN